MAHELLGNLLSEFGRFDEARQCFEHAIASGPLLAGCYYDLARCRPVTSDDDGLLERMEAALATPGLEAAQRVRLHLALGKAADDLGDYALAMQHFDAADAVRRDSLSFDSTAFAIEKWTKSPLTRIKAPPATKTISAILTNVRAVAIRPASITEAQFSVVKITITITPTI